MPTTVSALFGAAALPLNGPLSFGVAPSSSRSGIYIVSDSAAPDGCPSRSPTFSGRQLAEWLSRVSNMRLRSTGERPTPRILKQVLASWWLHDEAVLYIGCTTRPLAIRVLEFAKTPIGAGRPHAGGFWLQALSSPLFVFWAESQDPLARENAMLRQFAAGVTSETRSRLPHPEYVMPWANLEWPKGRRKPHDLSKQTSKE